jgi:hypothetical protein
MLTPAPLSVRVARVLAVPPPLAAYFLIRVPQVTVGGYVPWPEAVLAALLVAGLVPLWLFWVADLVSWRRERRTATSEQLELTEEQDGFFSGDLGALVDAEAHGRAVPPRHRATNYFVQAAASGSWLQGEHEKLMAAGATLEPDGETYIMPRSTRRLWDELDDRPTEPMLLTHEFTPASGIRMDVTFADPAADAAWAALGHTDEGVLMSWDPAADGQQVIAQTPDGRIYPVGRVDVVTGRHRRRDAHPIPPIADVENADAYAQINRTRELPF